MTTAVATGTRARAAKLLHDPNIFPNKIKYVNQTGTFLCKFWFIPNFAFISRQSFSQRWHFWVIHFVLEAILK